MTQTRLLHVDDEADIREVVAIALSLDPDFVTRSCASGRDAIRCAKAWMPDLILLDVMMPGMDGPATLKRLRGCAAISEIPVVFMTARAQSREVQMFKSLGAAGVIRKPFDPMQLATMVKRHHVSGADRIGTMQNEFKARLEADLTTLFECWLKVQTSLPALKALSVMKSVAHGLAGAGGIFGFDDISRAAEKLESAILAHLNGSGALARVADSLKNLHKVRGNNSNLKKQMMGVADD